MWGCGAERGWGCASGGVTVSVMPGVGVGELLEREVELACLDGLLEQASRGMGRVVVVEGEAGIGKSELLVAVRTQAQARGFGVLRARGSEFEARIAFGVARQVFEPMLRTASAAQRRRLLSGVAGVGARALGVVAGEPPADRFAALHGLFWLCANRAERGPVLVVVDDVQWVDDPSLAWLGYVARRVGDLALLLVLGLRSGDPGGERGELARLVGDGGVQRIALGRSSATAVGAIVRAQLDEEAEDPFCAAFSELTGGNPLLVRELLAAVREEGLPGLGGSVPALGLIAPAAVGTSVLGRLARMGTEAVALARAVALLGAGAEVTLAARLADMDPVAAELTGDRLAAAQILAPVRPLEFFHPLIGAAVLEDIAPGARRVAHRRAAALLDGGGGGSLARVAAHLLACGPAGDMWAVERLRDAALEALDRGAPEIAASYVRRALSEPPAGSERAALLFLLGTAEWRAGQPDAIEHLEQALAKAGDDPRTLVSACSTLALAYIVCDRAERAVEVLEQALGAVGQSDTGLAVTGRFGTSEPEALRHAGLALTLEAAITVVGMMNDRTAPAALVRAEALHGRLNALADPPVYLLALLAYYAARTNRAAEARELAERALTCEPYPPPLDICPILIATLTLIECYDAVQRLCEDLLTAARRRGAMQETVSILVFRATASCDAGALPDAEADARWALERADGIRRLHAVSEVIRVLIEHDDLEAAKHELCQLVDPSESRSIEAVRFLIARGRLRRRAGSLAGGARRLP